jgi:hypothetical protein
MCTTIFGILMFVTLAIGRRQKIPACSVFLAATVRYSTMICYLLSLEKQIEGIELVAYNIQWTKFVRIGKFEIIRILALPQNTWRILSGLTLNSVPIRNFPLIFRGPSIDSPLNIAF